MRKKKERSPSMQFYFRQFSGDENVRSMDLDTIGAHILLMCYAGASPERYRIGNNRDKIRRLLGQKLDDNFSRIWDQLLEGAWKISDDGLWIEQEGMRRALLKQKEFARLQTLKARQRWDAESIPDASQNDAEVMPQTCSSSTSTSTSTSTYNNNTYDTKIAPVDNSKPKPKKPKSWPPPGEEVRPDVFLTREQQASLHKYMQMDELTYWLDELAGTAKDKPEYWKKTYKDHSRVILKWRKMKLEKGFVWNPFEAGYRYPQKKSNFKTSAQQNFDSTMSAVNEILIECQDKGEI